MSMLSVSGVRAFIKRHYYAWTGVLMWLSFPTYDTVYLSAFPLFAWFAFTPLLVYVRSASPREVFRASLVTGIIGITLLYNWIGQFGNKVPGGYTVILVVLMPVLALIFTTRIWGAEMLARRFPALRWLILPALWVIVDGVHSVGYLAFPWTYWGYSQYPVTPLIQLSSVTGIFGITFLLLCSNALIADALVLLKESGWNARSILGSPEARRLAGLAIMVMACMAWGTWRINAVVPGKPEVIRVAMVQTCIDPWEEWHLNRFDFLRELKQQTLKALEENPDLLIWSESATLELISYDYANNRLNRFEQEVLALAKNSGKPLVTGEIGVLDDIVGRRFHYQNNAVLIDGKGEVANTYSKIHLVPFGEWFPYSGLFPWVQRISNDFGGSNFEPGSAPVLFKAPGKRFAPLICYEGIFFRLCRDYRRLGADFFVNIINLNWTDTYRGHMQGFASAKFRAVENGIWFLSAGNSGLTATVDPLGRVTASMPILTKGFLAADVDFSLNRETIYSLVGDLVLHFSLLFIGALIALVAVRRIRGENGA